MKVIFSLLIPLPLTSFCFVFSIAPSPPFDSWKSWLLFWSCSLKNWLAYCGAFTWPGRQLLRLLFAVLSPVFHSLLFLNLRSGPILEASIHPPNHFVLPAAISFTRRWAFFVFKHKSRAVWQINKAVKLLNFKKEDQLSSFCAGFWYITCTDARIRFSYIYHFPVFLCVLIKEKLIFWLRIYFPKLPST